MSDRFKFRAWLKDEHRYSEYLNLFNCCEGAAIYDVEEYDDKGSHYTMYRADEVILEQCTGLKDKNGKLIYENDIIDTPNGIYRVAVDDFGLWTAIYKGNPLKDVVEWSDIVKNYAFNKENVEIVILGNIHQDKELLDE